MRRVTVAEAVGSYREQLEAGTMTRNGIAAEIGITPEYVSKLCQKLGIVYVHSRRGPKPGTKHEPRPLGITAQKVAMYREQLEKGQLTMHVLGKEVGVTRERVRQLCKKLGIKPLKPHICRKCSAVLQPEERGTRYCNGCKPRQPRQKVRIAWCAQCEQPFAMTGEKRSTYIQNHKRGIKLSRCPDCLKAASEKYTRITVQCLDCGADVQRMAVAYYQGLQRGINGPVCNACRGKRMANRYAAKILSRIR